MLYLLAKFILTFFVGNDAVEEDIDIGGNDSPILSFPPIEIEKDTAHEILKASSSSSSGSSSGSSSNGWYSTNFLL